MDKSYSINEFFLDVNDDSSDIYINSSRPITVLSGVSCGNVPTGTSYCDHMVETIPPISELGLTHVVPPIYGRTPAAGYLVRVIASQPATTVTWTKVDGTVTTGTASPGTFYEINVPDATQPIIIVCSQPCLVMEYNKGFFCFLIICSLIFCIVLHLLRSSEVSVSICSVNGSEFSSWIIESHVRCSNVILKVERAVA